MIVQKALWIKGQKSGEHAETLALCEMPCASRMCQNLLDGRASWLALFIYPEFS